MAKIHKATADWNGGLKDGKGSLATESGALKNVPYTFSDRFEEGRGTNPEELIGAAHAGCFSMALSGDLGKAGYTPESIHTEAQVTLEKVDDKPTVTKSHLVLTAKVPGIGNDEFQKIAEGTKMGCPISRLLKAAEITLDAKLI